MPTLARPDVDVLEGLTTAIIVDQQRMGGDVRSTVGTATDANAMLWILFSRLGQPHIGSPNAYSYNVQSVRASGTIRIERGAGKTVRQTFSRTGGMCPRCEGLGTVSDMDLAQLFDETKSLAEGAITIPGYAVDGFWTVRPFIESASSTRTSRSTSTPRPNSTTSSTAILIRVKGQRRQRRLRGPDPEALPLLLTLSSGVQGFTTIHAGSPRQALSRPSASSASCPTRARI
jgi:excinuclease UvrABC ATPase subunit